MKILFASDIHGSAYYCRKLLDVYKERGAERLILLGDLLYHGPRNDLPREYEPKKVIELLNEQKEEICAVRGNCDAEVDQMVLNFPVMADYMLLLDAYLLLRLTAFIISVFTAGDHLPSARAMASWKSLWSVKISFL